MAEGAYRICGMMIRTSRPLHPLQSHGPLGSPDLDVTFSDAPFADAPEWSQVGLPPARAPRRITVWTAGDRARLCLRQRVGTIGAVLNAARDQISIHAEPQIPEANVTATFLGAILGFVLQQRGIVCLHASVVALGGQGVVVCGPRGQGKSTLAAALVRHGAGQLVADDIAAIAPVDGRLCALPGYPAMRLNPDAMGQIATGPVEDHAPVLLTNPSKRYLPAAQTGTSELAQDPVPVALAVLLEEGAAPDLSPLTPQAAVLPINQNGYAQYGAFTKDARAHEFQTLSRLCKDARIVQMRCHQGLETLDAQARRVADYLEAL